MAKTELAVNCEKSSRGYRAVSGTARLSAVAGELPHVAFHVVAGHHPQGTLVNKNAGGMARRPGRSGHFVPGDPVGRVPDVIAISLGIALQDPETIVEDSHLVILPRRPRSVWMPLPRDAVAGTPDVVEILAFRN